jgi:hypothetical protein
MNEDMILPDDFEMPAEVETVEDTTPTEETEVETFEPQEPTESQETEPTEQTPFLKVKYNKEEMELDEERAKGTGAKRAELR